LEYKVVFSLNNLKDSKARLKTIIRIVSEEPSDNSDNVDFLSELEGYKMVVGQGSKAYLHRNVNKDNKDRLFKPYKDLCSRFSELIIDFNPKYKFPHSLASTILEMAHLQKFFKLYLPTLTDFESENDDKKLIVFLESLLFNSIRIESPIKS
jgi:hypothetical protein